MTTASVEIEAAREPGSGLSSALLSRSPDAVLVRRAARGDRQAFAAIFERYSDQLYRYCVSILGNSEDASDALQAAMESALKAMETSSGSPRQLKPWLYRIAHNESISLVRRRRPEVCLDDLELEGRSTTEEQVALRARVAGLFSDLRDLPEGQRGALLMRELSGLGYDEIGSALTVSAAAAKQAVYEARVALNEVEEGRRMLCADARTAISDGDGRRLRGRRVRAHLKSCSDCAAFRDVLRARQADLAAIPPLGAIAGASLLASILGGGGGGGGGTGGAGAIFGGGIGSVVTAKGVAVVATGAIIAGAAGVEMSRSKADRGDEATRGAGRAHVPGENARHRRGDQSGAKANPRGSDRRATKESSRDSSGRSGSGSRGPGEASAPVGQSVPEGGGATGNAADATHPAQAGLAIADHFKPGHPGGQSKGQASAGLEHAGNATDQAPTGATGTTPAPASAEQGSATAPAKQFVETIAGVVDAGGRAGRLGGR